MLSLSIDSLNFQICSFSLYLKEEASDFLEPNTLKDLIKKYSQFINFNIYLWSSKTEEVEEPIEEEETEEKKEEAEEKTDDEKKEEVSRVFKFIMKQILDEDSFEVSLQFSNHSKESFYFIEKSCSVLEIFLFLTISSTSKVVES